MGQHPVIRSASAWSGGNLPTADLRQHGFVAGVREQLHSRALNADALSVAAQFKTAKGASAEARSELAYFRSSVSGYKPFGVPSIPGAHGYISTGSGFKGYNIYFSDGPFQYLVGTPERVEHFTERHDLGLFTREEQLAAFRAAGLEVEHDVEGLMGRGLYIARRNS